MQGVILTFNAQLSHQQQVIKYVDSDSDNGLKLLREVISSYHQSQFLPPKPVFSKIYTSIKWDANKELARIQTRFRTDLFGR
jgi:hypothetical protein